MSDDDKPPSKEELKAMMEKAKKIADEKKAEQESKVKDIDMAKHAELEKHIGEKAQKQN